MNSAHIAVEVDLSVYSVPAVLRAAYKFTDRSYIFLKRNGDNLTAFILGRSSGDDVNVTAAAFSNELIDQQLRVQLEGEFGRVRDLITAQAFSEGNLLTPERNDADYRDDPDGIGLPR